MTINTNNLALIKAQPSDDFGLYGPNSLATSLTILDNSIGNVINVKGDTYGAKGDGTTDDTAALQAAFVAASGGAVVYFPPGNYRITSELFCAGSFDVMGAGDSSVIKWDFANATNHKTFYWGVASYGGAGATYTGIWRNLKIAATNKAGGQLFQIVSCYNFGWQNVTIDYRSAAASGAGIISTANANNGPWSSTVPSPNRGIWQNCRIIGAASTATNGLGGGEGFGMSNCTDMSYINNFISGCTDDQLVAHNCTRVKMIGNQVKGITGGIALYEPTDAIIANNEFEAIAGNDGVWSNPTGINMAIENAVGPPPTRVNVLGNIISYPPSVSGIAQAMRINGLRDGLIEGNSVFNQTTQVVQVNVQAAASTNYTDPLALDTDGIARSRNVSVIGNHFLSPAAGSGVSNGGGVAMVVGGSSASVAPGPYIVENNAARRYTVVAQGNNAFVRGNMVPSGAVPADLSIQGSMIPGQYLNKWFLTSIASSLASTMPSIVDSARGGYWYAPSLTILSKIMTVATTSQTAGTLTIACQISGSQLFSVSYPSATPHGLSQEFSAPAPQSAIPSGAQIAIYLTTDGGWNWGGGDFSVDLYGEIVSTF